VKISSNIQFCPQAISRKQPDLIGWRVLEIEDGWSDWTLENEA
jgi:hypothetical protein